MSTMKQLCEIKGLSEAKVTKIQEACQKSTNFGFVTGIEILQKRQNLIRLSTGSNSLNELITVT